MSKYGIIQVSKDNNQHTDMEDQGINKTTAFMLIAFVLALIIGLFGIVIAIINVFRPGSFVLNTPVATVNQNQASITAIPAYVANKTQINYDFSLPDPTIFSDDNLESVDLVNQITSISPQSTTANSNLARIIIPDLKINAPIVEGTDGEAALDKGFWLYTPSLDNGEKIFLCHRRHWGPNHPYSCWYLDKLQIGANITIDTKDGKTLTYQVVSSNELPAAELDNVVRLSDDNVIKIITCAPLGFSTDRLVVIAKLIN